MAGKFAGPPCSAEDESTSSLARIHSSERGELSQTNLGEVARSVHKFPKEHNLEFPKRHDNKMSLIGNCGHRLPPDQVILISAAVSAGMKQVVCVPAGVSVPATVGKKVPSGFTVAP